MQCVVLNCILCRGIKKNYRGYFITWQKRSMENKYWIEVKFPEIDNCTTVVMFLFLGNTHWSILKDQDVYSQMIQGGGTPHIYYERESECMCALGSAKDRIKQNVHSWIWVRVFFVLYSNFCVSLELFPNKMVFKCLLSKVLWDIH